MPFYVVRKTASGIEEEWHQERKKAIAHAKRLAGNSETLSVQVVRRAGKIEEVIVTSRSSESVRAIIKGKPKIARRGY